MLFLALPALVSTLESARLLSLIESLRCVLDTHCKMHMCSGNPVQYSVHAQYTDDGFWTHRTMHVLWTTVQRTCSKHLDALYTARALDTLYNTQYMLSTRYNDGFWSHRTTHVLKSSGHTVQCTCSKHIHPSDLGLGRDSWSITSGRWPRTMQGGSHCGRRARSNTNSL